MPSWPEDNPSPPPHTQVLSTQECSVMTDRQQLLCDCEVKCKYELSFNLTNKSIIYLVNLPGGPKGFRGGDHCEVW